MIEKGICYPLDQMQQVSIFSLSIKLLNLTPLYKDSLAISSCNKFFIMPDKVDQECFKSAIIKATNQANR